MFTFSTVALAIANIASQLNCIPGSVKDTYERGGGVAGGFRYVHSSYEYKEEIPNIAGVLSSFKIRNAVMCEKYDDTNPEAPVLVEVGVSYATISETPEGHNKVVHSFSTADQYYPWVFSIFAHANRVEAGSVQKYRIDGTAAQAGDSDAILYYKTTIRHVFDISDFGFQNILACWARLNEGDFFNFFVDIPGAWAGHPEIDWIQYFQLGNIVTLFGDNMRGTYYPPDQSPAMSEVLIGSSMRVDFYKRVLDDPWYILGTGEDFNTTPGAYKRGPFINLDILGQRKR